MREDEESISTPIRVLVVDDHPAVRQGLGFLLGPKGITVCAEADNCADALAGVENHHPDMALVDLSLGDEDGTALIAELRKRALPSLAYSIHEDERHVTRALAAGARGYVTKGEAHRVLVHAIHEVVAGRRFLSPRAAMALTAQTTGCSRRDGQHADDHESLLVNDDESSGVMRE
ncbi:MAG TPA: response regulator transcription factor [Candidatus Hydrogenedentes bacterium]|nr:response regulator transcription factor [Candidatus Hydrogenedentota bacterium]HPG69696.1 response regulator transcription factor [Candidatus Hydrogenedentota bacterium]